MMNTKEAHICRLCLKVANDKFEIDELVKQMLEILLLKVNLDITKDPIICQECMEIAKTCLAFKSICIGTDEIILSYSADRKEVKEDIKIIYKQRENVHTVCDEDLHVCRFCMTRFEKKYFIPLDTLSNGSMLLGYMAEMDFNIIENPIICADCKENLDGYFKFAQNSLEVEEKIKTYREERGSDTKGQVKLSKVTFTDVLEYSDECSQICKIEQDHTNFVYPEACGESIEHEELNIKDEDSNFNENSYRNPSKTNIDKYGDMFSSKEYHEETKSDMICLNTRENNTEGHSYKKNVQENMEDKYKCFSCTFETRYKGSLQKHMLVHKDVHNTEIYKCPLCTFETKHKRSLWRHTLFHHNVSKVQMYKCSFCTYETKYRGYLKEHMLVHKDISELKMFKCTLCSHENKRMGGLKRHMLIHKDVSEIKLFKCTSCAHEFKTKWDLKRHIVLIHKDVSEVKMYKCPSCSYETRNRYNLKGHLLVHMNVSEIKMYKCALCAYEAKLKSPLKAHMLVHKDVSEIKMYKCALCAYEGKLKSALKVHMLVHKDVSEIKMYKCALCAYEGKRKSALKAHMLVHKDVSEIKMYNCSICDFKNKQKSCLKKHMLTHKDVSEIKMYKCALCAYEAKLKSSLKRHMLIHRHSSEIQM